MHKITPFQDGVRKFLRQKIWSLGTHLGSLGPGSRADLGLGPCRLQFLVIWGPYECPALTACQGTAENPKLIGAWCAMTSFLRAFLTDGHPLFLWVF